MSPAHLSTQYYETRVDGPLLILIPGANGEAGIFQPVAEHLSKQYKVVTYDGRRFSRSLLRGAQDYKNRFSADANLATSSLWSNTCRRPMMDQQDSWETALASLWLSLYWFERELLHYTTVEFDLDELKKNRSKLILAEEAEVCEHSWFDPLAQVIASHLDIGITKLPGPHLGYLFFPELFAKGAPGCPKRHRFVDNWSQVPIWSFF